jgi:hypothetical protein
MASRSLRTMGRLTMHIQPTVYNDLREPPYILNGTMSETTIITPRLLKTRDAARYLGISAWKLRNIVQAGALACIIGDGTSPWLFDIDDLNDWIERNKRTL